MLYIIAHSNHARTFSLTSFLSFFIVDFHIVIGLS